MGQLNLNFMACYFIKENVYKLSNRSYIHHALRVTWTNFGEYRHIMYTWLKYALTQYTVVLSTSCSGADIRTTPQWVGHKMVVMATQVAEQRGHEFCILWLNFSKNAKVYIFKNRHISSAWGPGHMNQFWCKYVSDIYVTRHILY